MGLLSVLSIAHRWTAERIQPGDTVIDATAGNGVDTLFLAEAVGPNGTVYAFDVQAAALQATRQRLQRALGERGLLPQLLLLLQSHHTMLEALPQDVHGRIAAVLFNLGYLPGADAAPALITSPQTTLPALAAALQLLRPGGLLSVVVYPGHAGGDTEAALVEEWAAALPASTSQAAVYRMLQKPRAPYFIAIEKR